MAKLEIEGIEGLREKAGQELGTSDWIDIGQDDVGAFADATGDHQWIHVDPERAKETPFGGTIAHGLLTLSLGPRLMNEVVAVNGISMALNYGYDKVRYPSPLPTGTRLRMSAEMTSVDDVQGGVQTVITQTFEGEGIDKPVCVAQHVVRWYGG